MLATLPPELQELVLSFVDGGGDRGKGLCSASQACTGLQAAAWKQRLMREVQLDPAKLEPPWDHSYGPPCSSLSVDLTSEVDTGRLLRVLLSMRRRLRETKQLTISIETSRDAYVDSEELQKQVAALLVACAAAAEVRFEWASFCRAPFSYVESSMSQIAKDLCSMRHTSLEVSWWNGEEFEGKTDMYARRFLRSLARHGRSVLKKLTLNLPSVLRPNALRPNALRGMRRLELHMHSGVVFYCVTVDELRMIDAACPSLEHLRVERVTRATGGGEEPGDTFQRLSSFQLDRIDALVGYDPLLVGLARRHRQQPLVDDACSG